MSNSRAPDFQRLPEADVADMQHFLDQLRVLLPIVGFDLFRVATPSSVAGRGAAGPVFIMAASGATARAIESEGGFVVLAGSTARRSSSGTFPEGYRSMRDGLVSSGHLIDTPAEQVYRFGADVVFSSPSAAAAVVAGRSASGPLEWQLESGQTYRDWKAAQLA